MFKSYLKSNEELSMSRLRDHWTSSKSTFLNGSFPASFSLFSSFLCSWQWTNVLYKSLQLTGFELRTSGVGSNRSTSWVTTTVHRKFLWCTISIVPISHACFRKISCTTAKNQDDVLIELKHFFILLTIARWSRSSRFNILAEVRVRVGARNERQGARGWLASKNRIRHAAETDRRTATR